MEDIGTQKIKAVNLVIVEKANLLNKRIHTFKYNYAGIKEAEKLFRDKFVEYNPEQCNPETDESAWEDVFEGCLDDGFFETKTIHVSLKY